MYRLRTVFYLPATTLLNFLQYGAFPQRGFVPVDIVPRPSVRLSVLT